MMLRHLFAFIALFALAGCSTLEKPSAAAVSDLAPTGKLRAAINFGNPVLASRDAAGQPQGVSVDLARELSRRLGVPVELMAFDAAGKVVEAGKSGAWDIALVALGPARGAGIWQSPPHVVVAGAYLVRDKSQVQS